MVLLQRLDEMVGGELVAGDVRDARAKNGAIIQMIVRMVLIPNHADLVLDEHRHRRVRSMTPIRPSRLLHCLRAFAKRVAKPHTGHPLCRCEGSLLLIWSDYRRGRQMVVHGPVAINAEPRFNAPSDMPSLVFGRLASRFALAASVARPR
jgi:hypothetical protein